MTITQTVDIPANRRITLEVPRKIPTGRTIITFTPARLQNLNANPFPSISVFFPPILTATA